MEKFILLSLYRNIDLGYNSELTLVKSNAFKSASGLRGLKMLSSSSRIEFEDKSLYTTASNPTFSLHLDDRPPAGNNSSPTFADDAFGNVAGGELWDTLSIGAFEFREKTFRLMLKAAFDKNADHLFETNYTGPIWLDGCMDDCTHAWIYKDAQKYGMKEYEKLIGGNVICMGNGPVLSHGNPELYAHFERCPSK